MPNLGRRVEKAITKEIGAQTRRESNISVAVTAAPVPENTESITAENNVPETTPAATTYPTIEDCRAAINRTRIRFEGEDYVDKISEGYKKYHKAITSQVKQIVAQVSGGRADKIPSLPEESRAAFIAECDALTLDENGNIVPPDAPY